jgi:hypothetical protein
MSTPFEDFINAELQLRAPTYTKANTTGNYDANPNLGGAPAQLKGTPVGSWFYEETAGRLWFKALPGAATWVDQTAGGGAGGTDLLRSYAGTVVLGDALYTKLDGDVARADSSALSTSEKFLGFASVVDFPGAGDCSVRFHGDLTEFTGLTTGKLYLLSTDPGKIVRAEDTGNMYYPDQTPGSGHIIREVGHAASATTLFIEASRDFEEM